MTAKKAGTVTITATAGGVSGTLHITVTAKPVETVPVTSVEVTVEAGTTVSVGKTLQATATVKPGNATNKKVTWKSSDESIATVTPTASSPRRRPQGRHHGHLDRRHGQVRQRRDHRHG